MTAFLTVEDSLQLAAGIFKNRASRRDPALCGFCKCSHTDAYAALSKTPHALAEGLMLVFKHPAMFVLLAKQSDTRMFLCPPKPFWR